MGKILKPLLVIAAIVVNVIPGVGQVLSAAVISAITTAGITAGLGIAASALGLGPKSPSVSPASRERLYASVDPATPRKFVFGETAMATDIRYQEWNGNDQEYLDEIVCVASHKITSCDEIWFDDKLAWSGGAAQGEFAGYLTINVVAEGNAGNFVVIGNGAKWGANRRMTGLAYLRLRFKVTGNGKKAESPFAQSIPTRMTIIGKAAPVYDPRFDSTRGGAGPMRADDQTTWAYSYGGVVCGRNPANQLLTYLLGWRINGKLALGRGVPPARIDFESFITAANACDEQVVLSAGGTEARYRSDGLFSEADDPRSIIDTFEATMNAKLRDAGGRFSLAVISNDLATPRFNFDDGDILNEFRWTPTAEIERAYNEIRGRFTNASRVALFQLVDYPRYREVPIDGIERVQTLDLPMVQSGSQAQRLAKQQFARNKYQGRFEAQMGVRGWAVQLGDVVTLTFSALGWQNRVFRVVEHGIRPDGVCPIVLQEEHPDIYLWDADERPVVQPVQPVPYDASKSVLLQLLVAGEIDYADGSSIESLQPAMPDATEGAPAGTNVGGTYDPITGVVTGGLDAAVVVSLQAEQGLTIGQILLDVGDLQTIYGDTVSAETSALAAEASRLAAEAAQSASATAAATATTAAGVATAAQAASVTARNDAQAAFGLADQAKADAIAAASAAGGSATSASGSANVAATKAGEASTSAGAASSSASAAAASHSGAATSASAAQQSEVSARLTAAYLMPSTFDDQGKAWFFGYEGNPALVPSLAGAPAITYPVVAGKGRVMQVDTGAYAADIAAIGVVRAAAGRRYRVEVEYRPLQSLAGSVTVWAIGLDSTYSYVPAATVSNGNAPSLNVWATFAVEQTGDAVIANGGTFVRPMFRTYQGQVFQISFIRIQDITESYNAAASATAAAGSASSAAIKATEAGQSASAALSSQTAASTSAGNAAGSATAAAGSAGAAAGSASSASTSASQASTSESNAAGSASSASTSATNAANSATAAGGSAGAAATSASTASTKATEAGQSATSASGSANTATTKAGEASGSASAAAASASSAASSSTTAGQFASAAQSSETSVRLTAAYLLPSTFDDQGKLWYEGYAFNPSAVGPIAGRAGVSFPTVAGKGVVLQADALGAIPPLDLASIGVTKVQAGRRYRAETEYRVTGSVGGSTSVFIIALDASYNYVAGGTVEAPNNPSQNVWATIAVEQTGNAIIAAGGVYIRPMLRHYDDNVSQTSYLRLSDITESYTANVAAAASATSASNANISATNAATSASAASVAKVAAETAKSGAEASASSAAGSVSTAAGHASSASSSASVSATSADASKQSAAATLPSDFLQNGRFWFRGYAGSPTGQTELAASAPAGISYTGTNGTYVLRIDNNNVDIAQIGVMQLTPGRRLRMTVRYYMTALGAAPGIQPYFIGLNNLWEYVGAGTVSSGHTPTAAETWYNPVFEANSDTLIAGGATRVRAMVRTQVAGIYNFERILLEDVTGQYNAANSASAASTSASAAGISETNAGSSASASAASANTASIKAGEALSSAGTAASSAATATGAAASATSSATLAASIALDSMVANPQFANWPGVAVGAVGHPATWVSYAGASAPQKYQSGTGGFGASFNTPANTNWGMVTYSGDFLRNGYFVLECDASLESGSFIGAGLYFGNGGPAAGILNLATDVSTTTGGVVSAPVANRVYSWRKLVNLTGATGSGVFYVLANYDGFGTRTGKQIAFWRTSIRPALQGEIDAKTALDATNTLSASVSTLSGAVTNLQGRSAAYMQQVVNAGAAATAFVELRAEVSPGSVTSSVAIGAREVHIYNQTGGVWSKVLSVAGGNVVVNGSLTATSGIYLGNGSLWRVQYAQRTFAVTDGVTVSFGTGVDLGAAPQFTFAGDNLAPLVAGETYRLFADAASGTGFIPRLRIITPGTTASYSLTVDTAPGTGPTRQIDKAANPDATNNVYSLQMSGTFTNYAYNDGGYL